MRPAHSSGARSSKWGIVVMIAGFAMFVAMVVYGERDRLFSKGAVPPAHSSTPSNPSGTNANTSAHANRNDSRAMFPTPPTRDDTRSQLGGAPPDGGPATTKTLWQKRLERAQFTLDSYLAANRYPPHARPASEHPDQLDPAAPIVRKTPLKTKDGKATSAKVALAQDRHVVIGDETVRFSLTCENEAGPLACAIKAAHAYEIPTSANGPSNLVAIEFRDDGAAGDDKAGDGAFAALFTPAKTRFASYRGAIRVDVEMTSGPVAEGSTSFTIDYTPEPPAIFTRRVREVVENGSLALYVGLAVKKPGRYVVAARLDDANGKTFALLRFNDTLPRAVTEVRLELFGKLVHDLAPQQPFKLRDVDGFLLLEDRDPDREAIPALRGHVHTTTPRPLDAFSKTEWSSEEKDRHVKEFQKTVDDAKTHAEGGN